MSDQPNAASHSGILRVDIADRDALYAAYMPFINNGGLFVPRSTLGDAGYDLGAEVFLLVHLLEHNERLPIAGKVVWNTPPGAGVRWPPGIGIQFSSQDNGANQRRIDTLLSGMHESTRPTHTL